MKEYKHPIRRSIVFGGTVFVILLSALLAVQSYTTFSRSLYARCDAHLRDVVTYTENLVDVEDMRECIRTGVPSEKYNEIQRMLNQMVDDFDLTYIYLCIPIGGEHARMVNVVSSTSEAERAEGIEDIPLLYYDEGYYTPEELEPYLEAWNNSPEISSFETNSTEFGLCYILCKPLVTADGETIALTCADIYTSELRSSINTYVLNNVLLTVVVCTIFGLILILWLNSKVTGPVLKLEKSAQRFMKAKHEAGDLGALAAEASEIRTDNELESLADAIAQMSREMKTYVEDTEARAQYAAEEAEGMARVAFQDPLTHVKNKTAYDAKKAELDVDITEQRAEFAIVMVDLNDLKKINDTYGHENGNRYIVGGCMLLCGVYEHSPVYRAGGDEFIAVLQGRDYENRDELFETLQDRFRESGSDARRSPWERYSAAAGMAVYDKVKDESVNQVFRRADEVMYRNKKAMKENRASNPA